MAFFDDMAKAIQTYPDANVKIEIIDFQQDGTDLNVNEEATFKVRITNNGPLDMKGVRVHVTGQNGTRVRNFEGMIQAGQDVWVGDRQSVLLDALAGNGSKATLIETFKLKAPKTKAGKEDLVTVSLDEWDADLTAMFNGQSVPRAQVKDVLAKAVAGD